MSIAEKPKGHESVRHLLLYRLIWVRKLVSSSKVPCKLPPFSAISTPIFSNVASSNIHAELLSSSLQCFRVSATSCTRSLKSADLQHTNGQPQDDWFTPTCSRDFNDGMSKEMSASKHQATKYSSWWYTYSLTNLLAALYVIIIVNGEFYLCICV